MFSEDSGVFRRVFHSNTGPLTNILVLDIRSERVPFDEWLVKPVLHGHRCSILQLTSTENASFMSLNHPPETPPPPALVLSSQNKGAIVGVTKQPHFPLSFTLKIPPYHLHTEQLFFCHEVWGSGPLRAYFSDNTVITWKPSRSANESAHCSVGRGPFQRLIW